MFYHLVLERYENSHLGKILGSWRRKQSFYSFIHNQIQVIARMQWSALFNLTHYYSSQISCK